MADDKAFQDWLERIVQYPLPQNKMARVRVLAKELAEGASEGFWDTSGLRLWGYYPDTTELKEYFGDHHEEKLAQIYETNANSVFVPLADNLRTYFQIRWSSPSFNKYTEFELLRILLRL
jgi:hypothetical protein